MSTKPPVKLFDDAHRWRALLAIAGNWQDGSDTRVSLFQDEATRECFIKVGGMANRFHVFSGPSFDAALNAAAAERLDPDAFHQAMMKADEREAPGQVGPAFELHMEGRQFGAEERAEAFAHFRAGFIAAGDAIALAPVEAEDRDTDEARLERLRRESHGGRDPFAEQRERAGGVQITVTNAQGEELASWQRDAKGRLVEDPVPPAAQQVDREFAFGGVHSAGEHFDSEAEARRFLDTLFDTDSPESTALDKAARECLEDADAPERLAVLLDKAMTAGAEAMECADPSKALLAELRQRADAQAGLMTRQTEAIERLAELQMRRDQVDFDRARNATSDETRSDPHLYTVRVGDETHAGMTLDALIALAFVKRNLQPPLEGSVGDAIRWVVFHCEDHAYARGATMARQMLRMRLGLDE